MELCRRAKAVPSPSDRRAGRMSHAVVAVGLMLAAPAPADAAQVPRLPVVDHIIVHKAQRVLELRVRGRVWRVITDIQLGGSPVGAKHFQGDGRTPEGHYVIDAENRDSFYDLALHLSYPNEADRAYARRNGRAPGGAIFIHGQPEDWTPRPGRARAPGDWTDGCIALSDNEIELLWQVVPNGTPIDIMP